MLWAGSLVLFRERGDGNGGVLGQAMDSSTRCSSRASSGDSGFNMQKLEYMSAGWVTVAAPGTMMVMSSLSQN